MFSLYDLRNNFAYYYDFYISAKEKNYAEAGRKNNISGSSLTRSVKELESILNLSLVSTNNKGFELTLDGERLFKSLEKFFDSINVFSSEELLSNLDVVLTIGTTRNIADFGLSKFLTKFNKLYPDVKYKIFIDSASNLNDYLLNRKIDVLIDYIPNNNYSEKFDIEIKSITQFKTCFACSKSYYKLVISGSSRRRQMLDDFLQVYKIKLTPQHLMPDSKLMADFIKDNDYIGYFMEDELKEYDLVKIDLKEQMPINPIGIIYPKNVNRVVLDFVKMVINESNDING